MVHISHLNVIYNLKNTASGGWPQDFKHGLTPIVSKEHTKCAMMVTVRLVLDPSRMLLFHNKVTGASDRPRPPFDSFSIRQHGL